MLERDYYCFGLGLKNNCSKIHLRTNLCLSFHRRLPQNNERAKETAHTKNTAIVWVLTTLRARRPRRLKQTMGSGDNSDHILQSFLRNLENFLAEIEISWCFHDTISLVPLFLTTLAKFTRSRWVGGRGGGHSFILHERGLCFQIV